MKEEINRCKYFDLEHFERLNCPKMKKCDHPDMRPCGCRIRDCLGITKDCKYFEE